MPKQIPDAQILEAALQVVVQRGLHAATTRQIAEAAGINEVTLFRRFGSKQELLQHALRREIARITDQGGTRPTGDLHADLERIVRRYTEVIVRMGRLVPTLLAELPRDPELVGVLAEPQRMIAEVGELLAHYQDRGELAREPPLQAVAALLGPLLVGGLLHGLPAMSPELPDSATHVGRFLDGRATSLSGIASPPRC